MEDEVTDLEPVAKFTYEMGLLKRSKRTGWWLAGVKDPETVAEHSFRAAVIAYLLAVMEGADANRAATLALWHDTGESRTGDIPSVGRSYLSAAQETDVIADQASGFPPNLRRAVQGLIGEYEGQESLEAQLARDADKLDCLLQAREYVAQGYAGAESWATSSAEAVRSRAGRQLAEAALAVSPLEWWRTYVEGHNSRPRMPQLRRVSDVDGSG